MASVPEVKEAVLDLMLEAAKTKPATNAVPDRVAVHKAQAETILKLAEAYAWVVSPSHSG